MTAKSVLMRPQGLCSGARAPSLLRHGAGVHQAFGVEKIMLHFVCHRLRKL